MKQKEGFVLRTVCGEHVIVGEGLDAQQAHADVEKMVNQWKELGIVEG